MNTTKEQLKKFILECLEEKNASDISCIKIETETPIAEYMIFANGRSVTNIKAIAEYTAIKLKHKLKCQSNIEGLRGSDWILLDAGDVIVHLFHPEARTHYNLEKMWNTKK